MMKKQLLVLMSVTALAVSIIQLTPTTLDKSSHNNWETFTHVKKLSF